MHVDDDIPLWDLLARRLGDDPGPEHPRRPLDADRGRSSDRLIDAAIGVVGSLRLLLDVAEDLLEERRAGDAAPGHRAPARARPTDAPPTSDIEDVPFEE